MTVSVWLWYFKIIFMECMLLYHHHYGVKSVALILLKSSLLFLSIIGTYRASIIKY